MENLNANTIELFGKHLIEASAGTGKTHNITRIFLRLLLERELKIEQILVMTFTKDATEEIRGRIDSFLRECIHNWQHLITSDDYFIALSDNLNKKGIYSNEIKARLTQALLYIDEAAIFTIHGFCKRVLNQYAFSSGISFSAKMEADTQDLTLEACQDWYRILALGHVELSKDVIESYQEVITSTTGFDLVSEFWQTPIAFIKQFGKTLSNQQTLEVQAPDDITNGLKTLVLQAIAQLTQQKELLTSALIEVKKGAEQAQRANELAQLLTWLEQLANDINGQHGKMPDAFIDGRRFSRSKFKAELVGAFAEVNQVKKLYPLFGKMLRRAQALLVVRQGIYHIREQIKHKKSLHNVMGFDDLITTLHDCLAGDDKQSLANSIYQQFPVALIDEFQDTDPQQFSILKAIYYHQEKSALYMIGDPKQAIYGFRGGDVFAYLSARNDCEYQWLMDTNWRSSAAVISGYNRLFYGSKLSGPAKDVFGYNIPYLPVKSSVNAKNKVFNESRFSALQFVHFAIDEKISAFGGAGKPIKQSFRTNMALWCAQEISQLLNDVELNIASGDIALLVRDGSEAASIKLALDKMGLASVFMSNRANLLQSDETQQLLTVLNGILQIENERLYMAALASPLMGFNREKLITISHDEHQWQTMKASFEQLRKEWQFKGFISMALKLMHQHFAIGAIAENGEQSLSSSKDRVLTNLLHLFELLQSASQRHRQPQELLFWFEQQSQVDNPDTEAELRLESDDNLIRIITQHGSKGMEYPVVFVPFATRYKDPLKLGNQNVSLIEYHNEQGRLTHSLDGSEQAKLSMANEAYAEAIRLLYVAVTRAEKRCYILSSEFEQFQHSPLGKTLNLSKDSRVLESLEQLVLDEPDAIGLTCVDNFLLTAGDVSELASQPQVSQQLQAANNTHIGQVAKFKGAIERDWWLSSFSALSKNLRHHGVSSPDRDLQEGKSLAEGNSQEPIKQHNIPLRFSLAKGAHAGNLLHDILEHTDFSAANWLQSCQWPLLKFGQLDNGDEKREQLAIEELYQWLDDVLMTPLVTQNTPILTNAFCLKDLTLANTLRETEFYFPMHVENTSTLTKLLTEHRNKNCTAPNRLHVHLPSYQQLKGMMHGFIDLIFQADGKFYVCDYKSSHLGDDHDDYSTASMRENLEKNHYDLQYLIYSLALHRHLKYSLADYQPELHFGGVYYLYLRGMSEQEQYRGCGVYFRGISVDELTQLDETFVGEDLNA